MKKGYLSHLTESIEGLLNQILSPEGHSFFRRSPRVVSGVPFSPSSSDFHLYFLGHELVDRDPGTFRCEAADGSSLVLRNPDRIRVNYALLMSQNGFSGKLEVWDKLINHFFDSPTLSPFLPPGYEEVPGLLDRLTQEKATLVVSSAQAPGAVSPANEPVQLHLQYSALYHSGAVLDRQALVKQRVIEYRNHERRVP